MLTTVTSWLWIDIHRQIGVLYTAYTTIPNLFCSLSFFFSDIQPIKERGKQQVCLCHQYIYIYRSNIEQSIHIQSQTHTHTHTHTQYIQSSHRQTHTSAKFSRKKGKGLCRTTDTIDCQPPPPPRPPPPRLSPFGWSQTIKPTLPSYTGYHQFGGGGGGGVGGGVMIPTNSTNTTTTTKAMSCNKIGQSIDQEEKYMANKRELSQFSRCFSFVNSSGPTQTGRRRSTLNPDGGWTISTWSVSLPTILGGRDLCIWLPCKSWSTGRWIVQIQVHQRS